MEGTSHGEQQTRGVSKSPEGDPTALIDRFHTTLLGVMKEAKALGVRARYERLEPAVREIFSLPLMIRIAAGTHWSKGSDAQRQRLAEAFERMSVATYTDRFDGYSGESFETAGQKPGPQATTLVETKLFDDFPETRPTHRHGEEDGSEGEQDELEAAHCWGNPRQIWGGVDRINPRRPERAPRRECLQQ